MTIQCLRKAALAICILAVSLFAAENPFLGTWKLNDSKSNLAGSGIGAITTVHIESDAKAGVPGGDSPRSLEVIESTDAKGQHLNFTYELPLDGTPGKATGSPTFDEISLKRVDENTITATGKKDGKVVFTDRRIVSEDGKTMTFLRTGTDAEGKQFRATLIFDKQ